MQNLFNRIKVKSLAWIERGGSIFVVRMPDSVKQDMYYRPVGGSVKYGERASETVIREVMEELHTTVRIDAAPLILENLFTCEGKFGHEIDFIFPCSFSDPAFYEMKQFPLIEADGCEFTAMWLPMADCLNGKYRLVPEQLLEWCKTR